MFYFTTVSATANLLVSVVPLYCLKPGCTTFNELNTTPLAFAALIRKFSELNSDSQPISEVGPLTTFH